MEKKDREAVIAFFTYATKVLAREFDVEEKELRQLLPTVGIIVVVILKRSITAPLLI